MKGQSRCTWSVQESELLLGLIDEFNMIHALLFRRWNSEKFDYLGKELKRRYNIHRTMDQVRVRWKHIKHEYIRTKRTNNKQYLSKSVEAIYDKLDGIVERNLAALSGRNCQIREGRCQR